MTGREWERTVSLLTDTIATLTKLGVSPQRISWVENTTTGDGSLRVALHTCTAYRSACQELKATPGTGRWSSRSTHMVFDAIAPSGAVVEHRCWPHLSCWDSRGEERARKP